MLAAAELSESKVSGIVQGGGSTVAVGGAVGYAGDTSLKDNSASADVTAESGVDTGGFAGQVTTQGEEAAVTGCYASGSVTGGNESRTGGLIGALNTNEDQLVVNHCYASGEVIAGGRFVCRRLRWIRWYVRSGNDHYQLFRFR